MKGRFTSILAIVLSVAFLFVFSTDKAFGYADRCATGGPNNICYTSCTYSASSGGLGYSVSLSSSYCCSHGFSTGDVCNIGASVVGARTGSGSWDQACGNSWGSYSGSIVSVPASMKGSCGIATSTPSYTQPTTNACGTIGNVVGGTSSPQVITAASASSWNWKCMGSVAAASVDDALCVAPKKLDGVCGSANAPGYPASATPPSSTPFSKLCLVPSAMPAFPGIVMQTNASTFNWDCPGVNGGNPVSCSAPKIVDGKCGVAPGTCTIGSPQTGAGTTWICTSPNGGAAASCDSINGICGSSDKTTIPPTTNSQKCLLGTPSAVNLSNGVYSWQCSGINSLKSYCPSYTIGSTVYPGFICRNGTGIYEPYLCGATGVKCGDNFIDGGDVQAFDCANTNVFPPVYHQYVCDPPGATANCSATDGPVVIGACGGAAGQQFSSAPTTDLCSAGTPSAVSLFGTATYTWNCAGANGGATYSCVAIKANSHTLSVNKNGTGSGTVTGGTIDCGLSCTFQSQSNIITGSTITLTAYPSAGSSVSWSNCTSSSGNTCDVTINSDRTVTATFTALLNPVDGECGPAAKTYSSADTTWTGAFCSTGSPGGAPSSFLLPGSTVSWTCAGVNGGYTPTCPASRTTGSTGGPVQISTLVVTPVVNYRGTCTVNLSGALSNYYTPVPASAIYSMTYCELRNQYTPGILYAWNSVNNIPMVNFLQGNILRDTLYTLKCWDATAPAATSTPPATRIAACRVNPNTIEVP